MNSKIELKVAQKIRECRINGGLRQEELSEKAEIDYKYIQKIEGKNPPNIKIETIEKLAQALNTKPSKLIDF